MRNTSEVEDIMFMLYDQDEIQRITIVDAKRQGKAEGRAEGKAEGETSATRKIVFRMLKKQQSDADIIELTEITADELNKFKAEYANA